MQQHSKLSTYCIYVVLKVGHDLDSDFCFLIGFVFFMRNLVSAASASVLNHSLFKYTVLHILIICAQIQYILIDR